MKKQNRLGITTLAFLYLISVVLLISVYTATYTSVMKVLLFGTIIAYILFLLIGTISLFVDRKPVIGKGRLTVLSILLGLPIVYLLVLVALVGGP